MKTRLCQAISGRLDTCPYAVEKKEKEQYLSLLDQHINKEKTENQTMEREVCKVYCSLLGEGKFVGYMWPHYGKDTPEECPLSKQQEQNKKGLVGFFSKVFRKKSS